MKKLVYIIVIVMAIITSVLSCDTDLSTIVPDNDQKDEEDTTPPEQAVLVGTVTAPTSGTLAFPITNPNNEQVNVVIQLSPENESAQFVAYGTTFGTSDGLNINKGATANITITNLSNGTVYAIVIITRDEHDNRHRQLITKSGIPQSGTEQPIHPSVCTNGTPSDEKNIAQNVQRCVACASGYELNGIAGAVNTICQQETQQDFPSVCQKGTPSDAQNATQNVVRCISCETGYELNGPAGAVNTTCQREGTTPQDYPSVCQNGTPSEQRNTTQNVVRCQSCDTGYELNGTAGAVNTTCVRIPTYDYICDNGDAVVGTATSQNVYRCERCENGYDPTGTLGAIGTECKPKYPYICTDGTPVDEKTNRQNVERCQSCETGYETNGTPGVEGTTCQPAHDYICTNGNVNSGKTTMPNVQRCQSCHSGFDMHGVAGEVGTICMAPTYDYICINGTPVDGTADRQNVSRCQSCDTGYETNGTPGAVNTTCEPKYPYICTNGNPVSGKTITPDVQRCQSCLNENYRLKGSAGAIGTICERVYDYICSNGSPVSGKTTTPDVQRCQSCLNENYQLTDTAGAIGTRCQRVYDYICDNGVAKSGKTTTQNVRSCESCPSDDYRLKGTAGAIGSMCERVYDYVCTNGVKADGKTTTQNEERCKSCTDSGNNLYGLTGPASAEGTTCQREYLYICTNGVVNSGRTTTQNVQRCQRCDTGYRRVGTAGAVGTRCDAAPDLTVGSITTSAATVTKGDSFTLSATVRNVGTGSSGSTTLRFTQSTNNIFGHGDPDRAAKSVSTLSAGSSSNVSATITAPSTPGTYYYQACVDSVTNELDNTTNCSNNYVTVVVEGTANLVVGNISTSETTVETGDRFTLSVTVRNTGDGSSDRTTLRYIESGNTIFTSSDDRVGSDTVSALNPGDSDNESDTIDAPDTPGTYYYTVCLYPYRTGDGDDANAIDCSSNYIRITVEPPAAPDLEVSSFYYRLIGGTTNNVSPIAPGIVVNLYATVRNDGTGSSGSTTLRYYRSSNSTITSSDTLLGTDSVSSLSAGSTGSESGGVLVPTSTGTYYFGACVDSVASESSTNNNCSSGVRFQVQTGNPIKQAAFTTASFDTDSGSSTLEGHGHKDIELDRVGRRGYVKLVINDGGIFAPSSERVELSAYGAVCHLYDSSGTYITASNGGTNSSCKIDRTLSVGTYYVSVGRNGSGSSHRLHYGSY